jgi:predicted transcriptional regulator
MTIRQRVWLPGGVSLAGAHLQSIRILRVCALSSPSRSRPFQKTRARMEVDLVCPPSFPFQNLSHQGIPRVTHGMKTAISIPDELFESADALAEEMGVSRSQLYATAVAEFVAKHRSTNVTGRLNEVYAEVPSGLEKALRTAQARRLGSAEG